MISLPALPLCLCAFVWGLLMRTTWTFHTAVQFVFGRNAVEQIGDIATRLAAKRALIITDPVIIKTGLVEKVRAPLAASGFALDVFPGGEPEPSMRAADACVAQARSFKPDV